MSVKVPGASGTANSSNARSIDVLYCTTSLKKLAAPRLVSPTRRRKSLLPKLLLDGLFDVARTLSASLSSPGLSGSGGALGLVDEVVVYIPPVMREPLGNAIL